MQYQPLKKYGITQSMSREGNGLDNAVLENFLGIMESELLYSQQFSDVSYESILTTIITTVLN